MKVTKTKWSIEYLDRKHGGPRKVNEWRRQKCLKLEEQTGVPWTTFHLRGKIVFRAVYDHRDTQAAATPDEMVRLMEQLPRSPVNKRAFNELANNLDWTLPKLMSVVKWGCEAGVLSIDIGRTAHVQAVGRAYQRK